MTNVRNIMIALLMTCFAAIIVVFGWNQLFGPKARRIVTKANEVVFVVDLKPTDNNNVLPPTVSTDPKFWQSKSVNTREVTIEQYCYQPKGNASPCENRDRFFVIAADTTPVNTTWIAPAIVKDQPMPDMSNAFSMQSKDSTGVYIGAQLVVRINPNPIEAAKYVAKYAYNDAGDDRTVHIAKPLSEVVANEFRPLIQSEFSLQFVKWDALPVNEHLSEIMTDTRTVLNAYAAERGIEIISFGFRDGVVYENPAIQMIIDNAFTLKQKEDEALADQKRWSITNATNISIAEAKAKEQLIVAQASADAAAITSKQAADAQAYYAAILKDNPVLVTIEWIKKWNGATPMISNRNEANVPELP